MDLVRELERRELSQAELAKATGLSRAAISLIASGRSVGKPSSWRAIRHALSAFPPASSSWEPAPAVPSWPAVLIKNRVWSQFDPFDGREVGGWLVGRSPDSSRVVVEAIVEEDRAVRSSNSISLDLRRIPDVERAQPPDVGVVGCFHGHPAWSTARPSDGDWDAWATAATTLRQLWLGLVIQEPRSPGQIEPNVSAILTKPSGATKWITPLRI